MFDQDAAAMSEREGARVRVKVRVLSNVHESRKGADGQVEKEGMRKINDLRLGLGRSIDEMIRVRVRYLRS